MTTPISPETAAWLQEFFIGNIQGEHTITMRVLESCPARNLNYRVNRHARSFAEILAHIYEQGAEYLLVANPANRTPVEYGQGLASKRRLIGYCASIHSLVTDGFSSLSVDQLMSEVGFNGERFPAILMADWYVVHLIHHRGQLCTYLENMGVTVPPDLPNVASN